MSREEHIMISRNLLRCWEITWRVRLQTQPSNTSASHPPWRLATLTCWPLIGQQDLMEASDWSSGSHGKWREPINYVSPGKYVMCKQINYIWPWRRALTLITFPLALSAQNAHNYMLNYSEMMSTKYQIWIYRLVDRIFADHSTLDVSNAASHLTFLPQLFVL